MSTWVDSGRTDSRAGNALAVAGGAPSGEIWEALQRQIYGPVPILPPLRLIESEPIVRHDAIAERWTFEVNLGVLTRTFHAIVVAPLERARALLVAQVYQRDPGGVTRVERALMSGNGGQIGLLDHAINAVLGPYIHAPPFERLVSRGVATAVFCPGDVIPDRNAAAVSLLEQMSSASATGERPGALAVWAALTSALRIALACDVRFASVPMISLGHSRHGKAALLAAALDREFAGVIAHQSGRFGASITEDHRGESPAQIVRAYPHWFCQRLAADCLAGVRRCAFDQHDLLGLIAPRPILLGNAASDFWADPEGSLRAAERARDLHKTAHGVAADIVSFTRAGWHGINGEDWDQFLSFVEERFS